MQISFPEWAHFSSLTSAVLESAKAKQEKAILYSQVSVSHISMTAELPFTPAMFQGKAEGCSRAGQRYVPATRLPPGSPGPPWLPLPLHQLVPLLPAALLQMDAYCMHISPPKFSSFPLYANLFTGFILPSFFPTDIKQIKATAGKKKCRSQLNAQWI